MNKLIKIAQSFETKLKSQGSSSDSQAFAAIIGKYENMSEVLDVIIEGLQSNLKFVEKDTGEPEVTAIIKEQAELIESAIMSIYPQISELDAKLYEFLSV